MKVKKNNLDKKRLYWLDILKIIACFLVIVNHCGTCLFVFAGTNKLSVAFYSIWFAVCKIAVPIFVMVSGYIFLSKKEVMSYKEVLKRILRIVVPLLLLSGILYLRSNGFKNINILKFGFNLLKEPIIVPYWYLYMLIGLYIATPFIQKIVKESNIKDLKVATICFLIIPSIMLFLEITFKFTFSNYLLSAILPCYLGYYIAGYYLSQIDLSKKNIIIAIITFVLATTAQMLLMYIPYLKHGEILYNYESMF